MLGEIADNLGRGVERLSGGVNNALFEPVIRLGVTGLSRAGKTVFITALVANLLDRGRMTQFVPAARGRIRSAFLQPQPDDTVPRFDYETHLNAMTGLDPHWPQGTRGISELRLSLRVQPGGLLGAMIGPRVVHIDIVDYPGEWLLDLSLMNKDFDTWSRESLQRFEGREIARGFQEALHSINPTDKLDEPNAKAVAGAFTQMLHANRAAGFSHYAPGRFLLPGALEGSPVLTFAPLPPGPRPRGSLAREFSRRFEAYKREVVRPFFRDHFAKIDRQVVLVDALGAIHSGPAALEDLRQAMADILAAFRPGRNGFLSELLIGKRVEKILFAATKADHLHHTQHPQLTAIMTALVDEARKRADFAGAQTHAMSLAALRATTEDIVDHEGSALAVVRGTLSDSGERAAFYPGLLPEDPNHLLGPARAGAGEWLNADYAVMRFAPQTLTLKPGDGPPHIRLDKAAQFLLGDRL